MHASTRPVDCAAAAAAAARALRAVPPDYLRLYALLQSPAAGAAARATNSRAQTALHAAAVADTPDLARLALARGARPAAQDVAGATPLRACVDGAAPGVRVAAALVRVREVVARAGLRAADGRAVLHAAAEKGGAWAGLVAVVAGGGADVDVRDRRGATPLHVAAACGVEGSVDVARALVAAGADVCARDGRMREPLQVAEAAGRPETADFLRACRARRPR